LSTEQQLMDQDHPPEGVDPSIIDWQCLDEAVLQREREIARRDLFFLAYHILGYKDIDTEWHRLLCKEWVRTRTLYPNRLALLPRGTFKTTLLTIADSIQLALLNPNELIAIMSAVGDNARLMLKEIKWHHLYNPRFRRTFPEYAPQDKLWGTKVACAVPCRTRVYREGTYNAIGVDEHVVSQHFTRFKKDDVQDEKNATNIEQLDSLDNWDKRTRALRQPGKAAWHDYMGTRWAVNDIYARIKNRVSNLWVIERDAERGPHGEPDRLLVPSILSRAVLDEQKQSMGSSYYFSQYRLNPIDPENAEFKESDLDQCWVDIPIATDQANFAVVVDPGFFKHRGTSETGIVVVGADALGNIWVVDGAVGKYGTQDIAKRAWGLAQMWGALGIYVEQISNEAVKEDLERLQKMSTFKCAIHVIRYQNKSKDMRIMRCQSYVETHSLRLSRRAPISQVVYDQFLQFPKGRNDVIDALAMGIEYAVPKLRPRSRERLRPHQRYIQALQSEYPDPFVIASHGHMDDLDRDLWDWARVDAVLSPM